jgi:hypothetical protein
MGGPGACSGQLGARTWMMTCSNSTTRHERRQLRMASQGTCKRILLKARARSLREMDQIGRKTNGRERVAACSRAHAPDPPDEIRLLHTVYSVYVCGKIRLQYLSTVGLFPYRMIRI